MMMRFLGWGIGHRNPHDFPHEADALLASREDRELVQYRDSDITHTDNLEVGEEAPGDADVDDGDMDADMDANTDDPLDVYQY